MSKVTGFLYKFINGIYAVLLIIVLGVCLFAYKTEHAYQKVFQLPNWLYAIIGLVIIAVLCLIVQKLGKGLKSLEHPRYLMAVLSVLFTGLLMVLTYHYYFKTGWDAQMVEGAAHAVANNDWVNVQNKYFSINQNNVFLVFVFSLPIRLGALVGIDNYYFCIIILQCVLFAATGYLLYRCAEMLTDAACGLTVWLIYVSLVGISPWVIIPYSDAAGLIFPTVQLYLFLRICRREKVYLHIFLLAFLCCMGYGIKPQAAIMGIAILIMALLHFLELSKEERKGTLMKLGAGILGIVLSVIVVQAGIKATHLELDDELAYGMPHYLMLGLNAKHDGVINMEDQTFSMSFDNAKERNAANLEVIKERIQEQGLKGLLTLAKRKTLVNFADGTFAWWEEGNFYTEERYEGNYQLRSLLTSFFYKDREYFECFKNMMQTLWLGCLIAALGGVRMIGKTQVVNVLKLSLIGITLFELIFEARARYLFIYAPIFILVAVLSVYRGLEGRKRNG